ncbi:MAG: DUF1465 family protein [Hyphomicrobiaceae bacterium]|nr:DUF1465 family protein [Hyphomicrobiaceae bacterium]
MSTMTLADDSTATSVVTVSFGQHFQASEHFDELFREGMQLVERTAAYLDGQGRRDSRGLAPGMTSLYAAESMRLTTRLLDLASWLLIQRSLKAGEITEAQARVKRQRVKLKALGRPSHVKGFDDLPMGLRELIVESFALHDRIVRLDRAMTGGAGPAGHEMSAMVAASGGNPVGEQMTLLKAAFGG